ncbi:NAD-dependent epimerase/dehydratase family protein [Geoglobus acetivorans]|uniref:NAD(P)-dependent oxidoreductase n=1 Tax=Geoglobus acetivorans TaxID=565033 RepID=A0ABZ3H4F1_GEOAI|nr:NAD(P)-dependent oxidoreductase [Geoglobus acetivorans]
MATLITGGAGFLGRFIARRLEDTVIFDLRKPEHGKFEFGSVTSWSDIIEVFKCHEIDSVIHTAADLSVKAEKSHVDAFRTNVEGTLNILEACRLFDVSKVIFISSHSVYGLRSQQPVDEFSFREPASLYGVTKACSEILGTYYLHAYGMDFRAVRFPILIGPFRAGMGASVTFSSFIDDLYYGRGCVMNLPPETKLPVLYVKDAAELVLRLNDTDRVSKPLFNAGGIAVSLEELISSARKFFPDFEPRFDVSSEAERIARNWSVMTELAVSSGILDRYRKIDELGWEIRWDSTDKIVEDHIKTLRSEVE